MNAVASGLIEAIKYAFSGENPNVTYPPSPGSCGNEWDLVPTGGTSWYLYGGGGINSWGTVCGVPNAAIAVLNLMNLHAAFAEQIMLYVCQTEFPPRGPGKSLHDLYLDPTYGWVAQELTWAWEPVPDDKCLAYTISNSPLCHASIAKWSYAAKVNLAAPADSYGSAHKTDRCAKTCADVAAFTAGLINGVISGLTIPDPTLACMSCHNTTGTSRVPGQQGKMDCQECHKDFSPHTSTGTIINTYSITVNVSYDGGSPIPGATVYLKQQRGSDSWKQIMYGYTNASGSITFANLAAGLESPGGDGDGTVTDYNYKVVVYKSGVDFNGAITGTQSKVNFEDTIPVTDPITLTGNTTIDIKQGIPGSPPSIMIAAVPAP